MSTLINLSKIVDEAGGQTAFARIVGVSQPTIADVISGKKLAGPKLAVAIEQATKGAVTRKGLRPNDWQLIWPELQLKKIA